MAALLGAGLRKVVKAGQAPVETPALHDAPHENRSLANGSDPDPTAARATSADTESEAGNDPTKGYVLVVDDDHDIRVMLRSLLEFEGFTVSEAADGLEGLAQLRASARPLIVLLDYKMPRMNGEELIHAVSADPDLAGRHAFIFVTANLAAFSPALLQVLGVAPIPVIQKPYSFSTVLREIDGARARLEDTGSGPAS